MGCLARVVLLVLACLVVGILIGSRIERPTLFVWRLKLAAGCELDYHVAPVSAIALACPHVDYIRLWPWPMVQPWEEPERAPERVPVEKMAEPAALESEMTF